MSWHQKRHEIGCFSQPKIDGKPSLFFFIFYLILSAHNCQKESVTLFFFIIEFFYIISHCAKHLPKFSILEIVQKSAIRCYCISCGYSPSHYHIPQICLLFFDYCCHVFLPYSDLLTLGFTFHILLSSMISITVYTEV